MKRFGAEASAADSPGSAMAGSPIDGCPLPASCIPTPACASLPGPKAGARCGSSARRDLSGGPPARAVPTGLSGEAPVIGVERRGRVICGLFTLVNRVSGRNWVDELKSSGKPFDISKWEVWEAYRQVKANKGAPGVDECSIADFEQDLRGNLYKIWNRMSSGSYFLSLVKAVEIPKPHGDGVRILGVPTVGDRIAQTVAARRLEAKVEPIFHPDSYGYRPARSALDAVAACRKRCCRKVWVIDLDIAKFIDSVQWDLIVKAVEKHTQQPWVVLYVKWWLAVPLVLRDGNVQQIDRG